MKKRISVMILAVLMLASVIILPLPALAEENYVTIRLHYHRPDGNYSGWEAWLWDMDGITSMKPPYSLTVDPVNGDAVCEFQVKTGTSRIGYIFRKDRWEDRDVGYDQYINITGVLSGTVDFYVEAGVPTQASNNDIPTRDELIANGNLVLGKDVITGSTVLSASYKVGYGGDPMLDVYMGGDLAPSYQIEDFSIIDSAGVSVNVKDFHWAGSHIYLHLGEELDLSLNYTLFFWGKEFEVMLPESKVTGDVTGDGKVNMKDWVLLYDYISEVETLTDAQLRRADVTKDGKVNMKDWARLYNHITEAEPL